ncbi:Interferon-induced GTP-binding protein MxB (IFN-inducible antiviral protein MxB) (Interferon-inducible MxB protein) [Durusdinium trenchii]|uniref:Interferon-induced GTP-binding protein MxB (IFN-inducible antiviral protein MxB) (Interferon-inducible MxB protein) n=1 Tax=Durusdinium trenchii TaxID=1381693 RepID=A0ABP0I7B0_9DINO
MSGPPEEPLVDAPKGTTGLGELLQAIANSRAVLHEERIDVPEIGVCGNQSSGKSSVLSSISGLPFPSGDGTCTRRPIIVHMKTGDKFKIEVNGSVVEFCNFAEKVRELQGGNGFRTDPVNVVVTKPGGTEMILTDLPGIVTSNEEDERKTKEMAREYLKNELCVIVVVQESNGDQENQAAFQLAREFDPDFRRSLVVLTKPDLLLSDTKERKDRVVDLLQNQGGLQHGYTIVRTRKGALEKDLSEKEMADLEEQMFTTDFPTLRPGVWGIRTLKNKLSEIQSELLRRAIPDIKSKISSRIVEITKELELMTVANTPQERYAKKEELFRLIRYQMHNATIQREYFGLDRSAQLGGAFDIAADEFGDKLSQSLDLRKVLSEEVVSSLDEELKLMGARAKMSSLTILKARVKGNIVEPLQREIAIFVDTSFGLVERAIAHIVSIQNPVGRQFPRLIQKVRMELITLAEETKNDVYQFLMDLTEAEIVNARYGDEELTSNLALAEHFSNVPREKVDLIASQIKASVGVEAETAFLDVIRQDFPNEYPDPIKLLIRDLKIRAVRLLRSYRVQVPRIVFSKFINKVLEWLDTVSLALNSEDGLLESLMLEEPDVVDLRLEQQKRLAELKGCLDQLP